MLVEGQVHGGVAQGIGQAITENVVFDDDGQLLTASFMDYGMPRADDVPMMKFATQGAVIDALWDQGVRDAAMPFTPHRVWAMLQKAKEDSAAA